MRIHLNKEQLDLIGGLAEIALTDIDADKAPFLTRLHLAYHAIGLIDAQEDVPPAQIQALKDLTEACLVPKSIFKPQDLTLLKSIRTTLQAHTETSH